MVRGTESQKIPMLELIGIIENFLALRADPLILFSFRAAGTNSQNLPTGLADYLPTIFLLISAPSSTIYRFFFSKEMKKLE